MPTKNLDPNDLGQGEDWVANRAAFQCPVCKKVFIVSDTGQHKSPDGQQGYRKCPECGKSIARIKGGKNSGGTASIEW